MGKSSSDLTRFRPWPDRTPIRSCATDVPMFFAEKLNKSAESGGKLWKVHQFRRKTSHLGVLDGSLTVREKERVDEAEGNDDPACQRQVDKVTRNDKQRREVERLRQLERADCVHAKRKNHSPVL